jgi:hypothetical protein
MAVYGSSLGESIRLVFWLAANSAPMTAIDAVDGSHPPAAMRRTLNCIDQPVSLSWASIDLTNHSHEQVARKIRRKSQDNHIQRRE